MKQRTKIRVMGKNAQHNGRGSIVVCGHGLIDYITVFRSEGSVVYKNAPVDDVTLIEGLIDDAYLVVINLRSGEFFADKVIVKKHKRKVPIHDKCLSF